MHRRSSQDPTIPFRRADRRTRVRLPAVILGLVLLGSSLLASTASATPQQTGLSGRERQTGLSGRERQTGSRDAVTVVEVSGLLDPVLADFVERAIDDAERDDRVALVLQLNSSDAVIDDERLDRLVERVRTATVPVTVWIGPSGSQAGGGSTRLVAAAAVSGMAPRDSRLEVTPELAEGIELDGSVAVGETVRTAEAVEAGLVDNDAPIIGDFILGLEGVRSEAAEGGGRQALTQVRFAQLPLSSQLMHTVASPAVAYLLFVIGLALLIFELYTAGIGIAGVVGAGCLLLGSYGLAVLPTRMWAVALLVAATFGYAVDVQVGSPRFWTGFGTVAFVLGSLFLFDGQSVSWITLLVGIVGMVVAMISGMPAMVRTRFSTPTIGREWMIGELGAAVDAVAPDGVVRIRDAPWRARTNRATPIGPGEAVRVVGIEGLVLEVEPESGGARDHRERRR